MGLKTILPALILAGVAAAQNQVQTEWGQCAGSAYAGPTACPKGNYCSFGNPWYSQCIPGVEDEPIDQPIETATQQTTFTVTGPAPTIVTTIITFLTPRPTTTSTSTRVSTIVIDGETYTLVPDMPATSSSDFPPMASGGFTPRGRAVATAHAATPTVLQDGQLWIRAVAAPNFHKYLQTNPANEPGVAILESSRTAGQFNVVDGQLVEWTGEGAEPLYMHVEKPDDLKQRTLATWFNTTKSDFGTFAFQGDALTWSTPEIQRQNLAAWLVCANHELFINTGAYAYDTPAGCSDQTIHYYNDKTAND